MPDPIARKRLKKKMLDRWENEGGALVPDTTTADATTSPSRNKGPGNKTSSARDNAKLPAPASPTKKRKPTPK